ncbi:unnamed protein product [Bursaphelenchus okinawaensis]|uniref:Uncharacterized protein n=1 Tax=Bursaphelenchus okinawaensis TaxID=465554 RepID=A0A811K820_9BILA|nr:unnamed protein product [Bursaphelenchus okinawaensis]CAG9093615.1 unnamed protein product [Bursaphelenchus okinawaensis]
MNTSPTSSSRIVAWLGLVLLLLFGTLAQCSSESSELLQTLQELSAKKCSSTYECWRTEPVTDEGLPLNLMSRVSKRLDIGNGRSRRGAKCRCKQGQCLFYNIPTQNYFYCQEF